MTTFKHQKQDGEDNCGPTCVAIIANSTQREACFNMFDQYRDRGGHHYNCHSWTPDIQRGLKNLKIKFLKKERKVSSFSRIRTLAIVSVSKDTHWVVYSPEEGEKGLVYDPSRKKPVPVDEYKKKPLYYITVRNPNKRASTRNSKQR
jgi:ABC-type bacteriocin/lantibiotic exporter with double-glycine peptidase domain